jgi:aconitate hydratase
VVLAKSFARIHQQNLINFGVLALTFVNPSDYDNIQAGDVLRLTDLRRALADRDQLFTDNITQGTKLQVSCGMTPRQVEFFLRGGVINWMKEQIVIR